ncbi:MAG: hypothetical protein LIP10_14850 [Clostridiales bacterium]|nr:hypothetical protein [Clostridiales bacterium]
MSEEQTVKEFVTEQTNADGMGNPDERNNLNEPNNPDAQGNLNEPGNQNVQDNPDVHDIQNVQEALNEPKNLTEAEESKQQDHSSDQNNPDEQNNPEEYVEPETEIQSQEYNSEPIDIGAEMMENGRTENEANVLMADLLSDAPHLKDNADEFREHLNLLYMMCLEGFSKDFLNQIFCEYVETDIVKLDMLHCAALTVDEEYALELRGMDQTLKGLREEIAEKSALRRFERFESIQELSDEAARAREIYTLHIKYLEEAKDDLKNNYNKMLALEKRNFEQAIAYEKADHKKDLENKDSSFEIRMGAEKHNLNEANEKLAAEKKNNSDLQKKLDEMNEKLGQTAGERDMAFQERDRAEKELELFKASMSSSNPADAGNQGQRMYRKNSQSAVRRLFSRKKTAEKDRDYVLSLISNPQFTAEQLSVINDALIQKLPPENLAKICDPKIPVRNMKMMLAYMQRSEMGTVSVQKKKEETHHEATNENS